MDKKTLIRLAQPAATFLLALSIFSIPLTSKQISMDLVLVIILYTLNVLECGGLEMQIKESKRLKIFSH